MARIFCRQLLKITDWLIPPAIFHLLRSYDRHALHFYLRHRSVLRANQQLHNRHLGERCFILCNGPSVREHDIRPLRGEVVLSVSCGYLHSDYRCIQPTYHFVPQVTYASLPLKETIDWFREMDQSIGGAELFLSTQEWSLVQEHRLFSKRAVHYLCMGKSCFAKNANLPDLGGIIPGCQSVPIMALMAALYMGFRQIYLLGVDHDWFVKKEYKYFYDHGLEYNDPTVSKDGKILTALLDDLPMIHNLWEQYRAIKHIAQAKGVGIYNATRGGMLDEFERVRLEDVVK